ncbi:MAG: DUF1361 domain-containing protein [Candidatus Sericytochromatia bacterium]
MKKYYNEVLYLIICSFISYSFFYIRNTYIEPEDFHFRFMIWNLILAWIPYLCSFLFLFFQSKRFLIFSFPLIIVWFFFFPNSFYLITDLIHIKRHVNNIHWFSVIMLFSFTWTGIILGFASLNHIFESIKNKTKFLEQVVFIESFIFLTSLGIYLGRIPRWNSWDVLSKPINLIKETLDIFINYEKNKEALIFIGSYFIIINMIWLGISLFKKNTIFESNFDI